MKRSWILILGFMVFLDQVSKAFIIKLLKPVRHIELINNFLSLTYLENYGAAFGVCENCRILFIIVTVIVIVLCFCFMMKQNKKIFSIAILMIAAGGIGNLIDRIVHGYVVDFISLSFFPPVFNLADCFITVGAVVFAVCVLFNNDVVFNRNSYSKNKKRDKEKR